MLVSEVWPSRQPFTTMPAFIDHLGAAVENTTISE
jgi:hypothetical protein